MPGTHHAESRHIALLGVYVDRATSESALAAAEEQDWAVADAFFDGYISRKRRPHFGDNLKAAEGCVALVDFDKDPDEAAEAVMYLHQIFAGRIVVAAVSAQNIPSLMLLAMRSGCTEFLSAPSQREIAEAFRRIEEQFANRSTAKPSGSIFAFVGAKGGVGTTTIAVHLATFLMQKQKKVLLIDSHPQFGHACIYLGLDGNGYHFQDLVRSVNRLDSELIRGFIATHPSGLDVLSSPDKAVGIRSMHPDDVAGTLEFLRSEYDFVLVDCTDSFDEVNRAVVGVASQVYVVATPEISAIRDLSRHVDQLVQLDGLSTKVKVVVNRYSSQFAINLEEIEKAIRLPVSISIPNSYIELVRSANLGVPLAPDQKSGFCVELSKWAASLIGAAAPPHAAQDLLRARGQRWGWLRNTLSRSPRAGVATAGEGA